MTLRTVVGITAILAPALHLASDVMELANGGFSRTQLIVNYIGFLAMPFLFVGLYAVQRESAHWLTLAGSLIYGASFVYFAHTTLRSLEDSVTNYPALLERLGGAYYIHGGALMVVGGSLFAITSLRARRLNKIGLLLFAAGIVINLIVAIIPVTEMWQLFGSVLRNVGLIGVGTGLLTSRE